MSALLVLVAGATLVFACGSSDAKTGCFLDDRATTCPGAVTFGCYATATPDRPACTVRTYDSRDDLTVYCCDPEGDAATDDGGGEDAGGD